MPGIDWVEVTEPPDAIVTTSPAPVTWIAPVVLPFDTEPVAPIVTFAAVPAVTPPELVTAPEKFAV